MKSGVQEIVRFLGLLLACLLALQVYFAARIVWMAVAHPTSTTFQRSEIWRLMTHERRLPWAQKYVDRSRISANLQRAVIASEDAGFVDHDGIEWDAVERARERNERAKARAARTHRWFHRQEPQEAKVIGGSTISQQLSKNLFLSGERTIARKAQEAVITVLLESLLGKRRILELYLNEVEWGEGVFGAEAAARRYFNVSAAQLSADQAARLAVMLPAPKRFERRPGSPYMLDRSAVIAARMGGVELP